MPTYVYDETVMPDEARELSRKQLKAARISYWKKFGDGSPGWLVGLGRVMGNRFVVEEEFVAETLVVNTASYGFIAYQSDAEGRTVDRGWIITFYQRVDFDGKHCIIS